MATMNPTPYSEVTNDNHGYNSYIKEITLPTGTKYEIVDEHAREIINTMSQYTSFLGVTTTDINDGSTTNVVVIGGESVTAQTGNIVLKSVTSTEGMIAKEFIYDGTEWQLFGDISTQNLGGLAYKTTASGSFTPNVAVSGTIGTITATGYYTPTISLVNSTTTYKLSTTSSATTAAGYLAYKPTGSISAPISISALTYVRAVKGNTLLQSITAPGTTASMTNGVNIATVATNCLCLSWLQYGTANGVSSVSSVTAMRHVNAGSGSFAGDTIYFSPVPISIPTGTTATTATIYSTGTAVTTVTKKATAGTVYVN